MLCIELKFGYFYAVGKWIGFLRCNGFRVCVEPECIAAYAAHCNCKYDEDSTKGLDCRTLIVLGNQLRGQL